MLTWSLVFLSGCAGVINPGKDPVSTLTEVPTVALTTSAYADELVAWTNAARVNEGLDALAESSCAKTAAQERARDLSGGELEHAPLAPVIEACAPRTTAAENLANSAAAPAEVVDAWMGSPGHRANIVDPALAEIGIGCVKHGSEILCSQVFLGP
ncbi:CAP domain-containing protein [Georgenia wangjunii]